MSSFLGAISFGAAFSSGFLTFFTPCVFPLIPAWLTLVTGLSYQQLIDAASRPDGSPAGLHLSASLKIFWPTFLFVLGFSLVFIAIGAAFGALGEFFEKYDFVLRYVGVAIMVVLGLYLLGLISPQFMNRDNRAHLRVRPFGLLGSFVVGMTFAAGWTPCVGPVLLGILSMAATQQGWGHGAWLLATFSFGLGVPFLLIALLWGQALRLMGRAAKIIPLVNKILGILILGLAILIAFDYI